MAVALPRLVRLNFFDERATDEPTGINNQIQHRHSSAVGGFRGKSGLTTETPRKRTLATVREGNSERLLHLRPHEPDS